MAGTGKINATLDASDELYLGRMPHIKHWIEDMEARKADLTDPDEIEMMRVWIEHVAAEGGLDLHTACVTLTDDGCSRTWGGGMPEGGIMSVTISNDDRRTFYERAFVEARDTMHLQEMVTERMVVGKDGIAFDGVLHVVSRGSQLPWAGAGRPEHVGPDEYCLVSRRVSGWNSFRDGKIVGEDRYRDQRVHVEKVDWKPGQPVD